MQMFDIKGSCKVRGGFNLIRIVRFPSDTFVIAYTSLRAVRSALRTLISEAPTATRPLLFLLHQIDFLFRQSFFNSCLYFVRSHRDAVRRSPVTNALTNEALLFSSVPPDSIDIVTERGFMKEERQFGLGVYFIDNATKGGDVMLRGN